MAGGVIRSLITRILFRSDATGLKKVETHTRAAKREMRAASRAAFMLRRDLGKIAIGVRTLIGVLIAGRIAKFFTHDFAKAADEAAKFSKATGVSIETYQGLTHAIRLSGGDIGDLQKGLMQAGKRARDASMGLKASKLAFDELDVSVKNADGSLKDQDQILFDVAEKLKVMKDGSKKTALVMEIFGRSGAKLIPMFNQGAVGIKKMIAEAKALGIVLTKDQARIAEEYNDEMLRAQSVLVGVRNQIAVKLLPAITRNLRKFQQWARSGDNLSRALKRVGIAVKFLVAALTALITVKVVKTYILIVDILKKAYFWMEINGKAALRTQLIYMKWVFLIAGLVLVIQSLYVWSKGGKSAIGDLFEHFGIADKARMIVEHLGKVLKWIGTVGLAIGKILWKLFIFQHKLYLALWREFGPALKALGKALVELWRELAPVIVQAALEIRDIIIILIGVIATAWQAAKPSIIELGQAMYDLWLLAKPGLVALWGISVKITNVIFALVKKALPYLGPIFGQAIKNTLIPLKVLIYALTLVVKLITWIVRGMKWAGKEIAKAWTDAFGPFNEVIKDIVAKVQWAIDKAAALTGKTTGLGDIAGIAAGERKRITGTAATQTNQLSIGAVSVSVQGTADMTPAEFEAAVAAGTKKALQKAVTETYATWTPFVAFSGGGAA